LRRLNLNGYIDDEAWLGDEITPDLLHAALYGEDGQSADDVQIVLNSYGGSCGAAVRMFDDVHAYPGKVSMIISGTAASAATVLAMAADDLEMTPGSLYMIHDPSVVAWGNERDLRDAINLLTACKESILNVYDQRCKVPRDELARMMTDTTWMDAQAALKNGFIDRISVPEKGIQNAIPREITRAEAEARVEAYFDRHRPRPSRRTDHHREPMPEPKRSGVSYAQLMKRLELIK
jgi:ATP-dependent Clp protease protease subunit